MASASVNGAGTALPAHAGVILSRWLTGIGFGSVPRIRGGDPYAVAIDDVATCVPRTRGGDPRIPFKQTGIQKFSPHARGWVGILYTFCKLLAL